LEILRWKTRIAVLWVFMAVAMSAHSLLNALVPGGLEKAIAEVEAMGPGMLVFLAIFWLVPLWLAFVTMTVKDSCNRWTNFVLGIIFTILNIFHLVEHLAQPSVEQILIVGSTVVVTALIAWYAWKWPKQKA
jgi:drug/metabolite transporter (DMT)-like permease